MNIQLAIAVYSDSGSSAIPVHLVHRGYHGRNICSRRFKSWSSRVQSRRGVATSDSGHGLLGLNLDSQLDFQLFSSSTFYNENLDLYIQILPICRMRLCPLQAFKPSSCAAQAHLSTHSHPIPQNFPKQSFQ